MKFWYALMGALGLAAVIHVSFPNKAHAQQTVVISDSFGRPIEQAYTVGNTTFISTPWGAPLGTTTTIGGTSPTQPIIPLPLPAVPPLR
jgi:hypothetical protein